MDSTCPELDDFAGAFGRQCSLAAQALSTGHSREAVRVAFQGHGTNVGLPLIAMRANRARLNELIKVAHSAVMTTRGIEAQAVWRVLIDRADAVRIAVESEWGKTMVSACTVHVPGSGKACPTSKQGCEIPERWEHAAIPIVNVEGSS